MLGLPELMVPGLNLVNAWFGIYFNKKIESFFDVQLD